MYTDIGWSRMALPALALAATAIGCGGSDPAPEVREVSAPATQSQDCPKHEIRIVRGDTTYDDIPLASQIDDLPEFHDCQRFIEHGAYGPLAAIWAATDLAQRFGGALPSAQDSAAAEPAQVLAQVPLTPAGTAIPAAVIHIWNAGYKPLELVDGFNCLYLAHVNLSPSRWVALMVPIGPAPNPCLERRTLGELQGKQLAVREFPLTPSLSPIDIPSVARWDYTTEPGPNYGKYYIGLRCGNAWCEVGSFPRKPGHNKVVQDVSATELRGKMKQMPTPLPAMTDREAVRVRDVKGWHDEQVLMVRRGTAMNATVAGAAFPRPELDRITDSNTFHRHPIPSAYLRLDGAYEGAPLRLEKGVTTVELCRGTAGECGVSKLPACKAGPPPTPDTVRWWSRLVSETGDTTFTCVRRHRHEGVRGESRAIPAGAVRWAWSDVDESLWIRCADGCCTLD